MSRKVDSYLSKIILGDLYKNFAYRDFAHRFFKAEGIIGSMMWLRTKPNSIFSEIPEERWATKRTIYEDLKVRKKLQVFGEIGSE